MSAKRAGPAKVSGGRRKSLWDIAIYHDLIPVDFSAAFLALLCIVPSCYFYTQIRSGRGLKKQLLSCATLAGLGFFATLKTIPYVMRKIPGFLTGKDLCKKGTPRGEVAVPESLGTVSGSVLLICIVFCEVYYAATDKGLVEYCSATLSICFMLFLGLADDVLDLPWRVKFIIPTVATLPLLCTYFRTGGANTSVVLPKPVRPLVWDVDAGAGAAVGGQLTTLGSLLDNIVGISVDPAAQGAVVDLGAFYMLYMGMLSVFCTNAINIYAGINGLEAGQSFVIACGVLAHNLFELTRDRGADIDGYHLFSAFIMLPFIATTLGLLRHNWYPSACFVGDTFCYYAGMTFACVGILGHFSKTLFGFFAPQVLNFVLSLPQLAKVVPCPRHRLPAYNQQTGLLEPSRSIPGDSTSTPNLTCINVVLVIFGPMKERTLVLVLLVFQALCGVMVFVVRYHLAYYFYDE